MQAARSFLLYALEPPTERLESRPEQAKAPARRPFDVPTSNIHIMDPSTQQQSTSSTTGAKTNSGIVKLNVGGQIFTTSKSTLLKGASSDGGFFSSMLSGSLHDFIH
jgi:hypothetical protein